MSQQKTTPPNGDPVSLTRRFPFRTFLLSRTLVLAAVCCVSLLITTASHASHQEDQEVLIEDVLLLTQEGVPDEIIILQIHTFDFIFELTTDEILELRSLGVSDPVLEALIETAVIDEETRRKRASQVRVSTGYYSPWYRYPYAWGCYYDPFPSYWSYHYYPFSYTSHFGYYGYGSWNYYSYYYDYNYPYRNSDYYPRRRHRPSTGSGHAGGGYSTGMNQPVVVRGPGAVRVPRPEPKDTPPPRTGYTDRHRRDFETPGVVAVGEIKTPGSRDRQPVAPPRTYTGKRGSFQPPDAGRSDGAIPPRGSIDGAKRIPSVSHPIPARGTKIKDRPKVTRRRPTVRRPAYRRPIVQRSIKPRGSVVERGHLREQRPKVGKRPAQRRPTQRVERKRPVVRREPSRVKTPKRQAPQKHSRQVQKRQRPSRQVPKVQRPQRVEPKARPRPQVRSAPRARPSRVAPPSRAPRTRSAPAPRRSSGRKP